MARCLAMFRLPSAHRERFACLLARGMKLVEWRGRIASTLVVVSLTPSSPPHHTSSLLNADKPTLYTAPQSPEQKNASRAPSPSASCTAQSLRTNVSVGAHNGGTNFAAPVPTADVGTLNSSDDVGPSDLNPTKG
ncbi:hypothetical protein AAG570_004672 [Ranatra chinensis]|uniref:Uncharacterized protein n=1 Tax=Ranatra chinensis TaxID=642074 RepID=A0ABD0Y1I8_9HEMI